MGDARGISGNICNTLNNKDSKGRKKYKQLNLCKYLVSRKYEGLRSKLNVVLRRVLGAEHVNILHKNWPNFPTKSMLWRNNVGWEWGVTAFLTKRDNKMSVWF